MPILLGLTGRKGAGKDAAFSCIESWCRERGILASRRGFADALKLSFARLFVPDCTLHQAIAWCDEIKIDSEIAVISNRISDKISGRVALQRYGTEAHRDIFGDNFWVDLLLPRKDWVTRFKETKESLDPHFCVVADVRFDNEALRIKELGGSVIKIDRPDAMSDDLHASERGVNEKFIYKTILNDGTLEDLRSNIYEFLSGEYENT